MSKLLLPAPCFGSSAWVFGGWTMLARVVPHGTDSSFPGAYLFFPGFLTLFAKLDCTCTQGTPTTPRDFLDLLTRLWK